MNLFFIYVCLLTEIDLDVGVEGQLTYVVVVVVELTQAPEYDPQKR